MNNPKLKYLEDVPWDNSLKLSNGKTVHGLEQLPMIIKFSDDEVFYSHVNDQKNDISNWIRDVVGDSELAEKLLTIRKKEEFLDFMDKAITEIKNYKPPEPTPVPVSSAPAVAPAPVVPTPIFTPVVTPVSAPSPVVSIQPTIVSVVPVQPAVVLTSDPAVPAPAPVISVQSTVISNPVSTVPIQSTIVPTPSPVVVPVITPTIVPSVSPPNPALVVPPVSSPLSFPQSTPLSVSSPVVPTPTIPATPTTSTVDSFFVDSTPMSNTAPIPNSISMSESATTVSQTAPAQVLPSVSMAEIAEETFDFEDVFKVLITELEQDVLSWDTQTS